MSKTAEANAALIRARAPVAPSVGVVLGSGLGDFAQAVESAAAIPYRELEGFPETGVSGHAGSLVVGNIAGTPVAVMAGRGHYYENGSSDVMRPALETLKALGVADLVLTNAAGSLRQDFPPASVMLITDHINFGNRNPLIGEQGEARFVGLGEAYDAELRRGAVQAADQERVELHQGVYMWFSGPSFETPAEIRAARILGADAVGMSTVPEVILARFLGLRVLAFSVITNYGAGMTGVELSHAETKEVAPRGGAKLARLLKRMLSAWPAQHATKTGTLG
jgi:purine-nucleoside phosphorylase